MTETEATRDQVLPRPGVAVSIPISYIVDINNCALEMEANGFQKPTFEIINGSKRDMSVALRIAGDDAEIVPVVMRLVSGIKKEFGLDNERSRSIISSVINTMAIARSEN